MNLKVLLHIKKKKDKSKILKYIILLKPEPFLSSTFYAKPFISYLSHSIEHKEIRSNKLLSEYLKNIQAVKSSCLCFALCFA